MECEYVNKNDFDSCMDPSKPNQHFIQNQVQLHHHFDCDQHVTDRWFPPSTFINITFQN